MAEGDRSGFAATSAAWGLSTARLRERLRENSRALAPLSAQSLNVICEGRRKTKEIVKRAARAARQDRAPSAFSSCSPSPRGRRRTSWLDGLSEDEDDYILEAASALTPQEKAAAAGVGRDASSLRPAVHSQCDAVLALQDEICGVRPNFGSEKADSVRAAAAGESSVLARHPVCSSQVQVQQQLGNGQNAMESSEAGPCCTRLSSVLLLDGSALAEMADSLQESDVCTAALDGHPAAAACVDATCSPRHCARLVDKQTQTRWRADEARQKRDISIREARDREVRLQEEILKQKELVDSLRRCEQRAQCRASEAVRSRASVLRDQSDVARELERVKEELAKALRQNSRLRRLLAEGASGSKDPGPDLQDGTLATEARVGGAEDPSSSAAEVVAQHEEVVNGRKRAQKMEAELGLRQAQQQQGKLEKELDAERGRRRNLERTMHAMQRDSLGMQRSNAELQRAVSALQARLHDTCDDHEVAKAARSRKARCRVRQGGRRCVKSNDDDKGSESGAAPARSKAGRCKGLKKEAPARAARSSSHAKGRQHVPTANDTTLPLEFHSRVSGSERRGSEAAWYTPESTNCRSKRGSASPSSSSASPGSTPRRLEQLRSRSLAASGTDSSSSSEVERGCRRLQRRIAASSTDTRSNAHTSGPGKEEEKVWEDIAEPGRGGEVGWTGSDRGNAARESAWTRSVADMHAGGAQELGPQSLETLQWAPIPCVSPPFSVVSPALALAGHADGLEEEFYTRVWNDAHVLETQRQKERALGRVSLSCTVSRSFDSVHSE